MSEISEESVVKGTGCSVQLCATQSSVPPKAELDLHGLDPISLQAGSTMGAIGCCPLI